MKKSVNTWGTLLPPRLLYRAEVDLSEDPGSYYLEGDMRHRSQVKVRLERTTHDLYLNSSRVYLKPSGRGYEFCLDGHPEFKFNLRLMYFLQEHKEFIPLKAASELTIKFTGTEVMHLGNLVIPTLNGSAYRGVEKWHIGGM